jgi:hypothetical protein
MICYTIQIFLLLDFCNILSKEKFNSNVGSSGKKTASTHTRYVILK